MWLRSENFAPVEFETNASDFAIVSEDVAFSVADDEVFEAELETFHLPVEEDTDTFSANVEAEQADPAETDDDRLEREVDSIHFYIVSGYLELAEKAINELRGEFGERPEIKELRESWERESGKSSAVAAEAEAEVEEAAITTGSLIWANFAANSDWKRLSKPMIPITKPTITPQLLIREMGLIEQAISEFQDAVGIVSPDDGTRRFFQCANLLGHCFMQQGMPKVALKWFNRTLETEGLMDEEKQALWYEVAAATKLDGDIENAAKYFELVYAENVDFRDVRDRVKSVAVQHT